MLDTPARQALLLVEGNPRISAPIDYNSFALQALAMQQQRDPVPVHPYWIHESRGVHDATLVLVQTESCEIEHVGWILRPMNHLMLGRSLERGHTIVLPLQQGPHLFVDPMATPEGVLRVAHLRVDEVRYCLSPRSSEQRTWALFVERSELHRLYEVQDFLGPYSLEPTQFRRDQYRRVLGDPTQQYRDRCAQDIAERLDREILGSRPVPPPTASQKQAARKAMSFDEWLKDTNKLIDECSNRPHRRESPDWAEPLDRL
jgi:hypothetical protein